MTSMIFANNITKAYGKHAVLDGVTIKVPSGSIFALLGANGAGKTTLVRILSTLILPDSGTGEVAGFDVVKQADEVRKNISLTGQYAAVDELLSGEENMIMMGRYSHIPSEIVKQRTAELLNELDLQAAARRRAGTYSGGMRRRLDLAISLLASPPVVFLDEPTTGLDPRSRQELWRIIAQLAKNGTTIFLTTQYLDEADALADKIAVLDKGKIVVEGTASELKKQVGSEVIEATFGTQADLEKAYGVLASGTAKRDSEQTMLRITTDGTPAHLRTILNTLAMARVEPKTVRLRQPTLDDVFMKLTTGHVKKEEK